MRARGSFSAQRRSSPSGLLFSLSMRAKKRLLQQHRKFSSEPLRGDSGEKKVGGGLEPEGGELWGDVGEGGGHRV